MNRMEMLKNYENKKAQEKSTRLDNTTNLVTTLENKLFEYNSVIKECCELVSACIEHGYIDYETRNGNNYDRKILAEGIYHHVGFYRMDNTMFSSDNNVIGIGIKNGGANGYTDIVWDCRKEMLVFYDTSNKSFRLSLPKEYYSHVEYDVNKFLKEYGTFLNSFLKWFDEKFGKGETE